MIHLPLPPMKYRLFFLSLVLIAVSAMGAELPREIINFNREWKFQLGDHPGADAAGFDDSQWGLIGLPHSFSMPYFESPQFYVGYGWYRKHFDVPAGWEGKRLFVEFDGVFQDA